MSEKLKEEYLAVRQKALHEIFEDAYYKVKKQDRYAEEDALREGAKAELDYMVNWIEHKLDEARKEAFNWVLAQEHELEMGAATMNISDSALIKVLMDRIRDQITN